MYTKRKVIKNEEGLDRIEIYFDHSNLLSSSDYLVVKLKQIKYLLSDSVKKQIHDMRTIVQTFELGQDKQSILNGKTRMLYHKENEGSLAKTFSLQDGNGDSIEHLTASQLGKTAFEVSDIFTVDPSSH